jgi:hypothetical protein
MHWFQHFTLQRRLLNLHGVFFAYFLLIGAFYLPLTAAPANPSLPPVAFKIHTIFAQLREAEESGKKGQKQPGSFQLSEAEVNEYIKYSLAADPRPGVKNAIVKFFSNNYLSTLVTLDFDAVERWKPGTIPVLLKPILAGQKSIRVDYRFGAHNGLFTFSVEKSYFQNVWIPALVTQKMIEVVLSRQREKVDASKPIPLPFGLKEAWTGNQLLHGQN